MDSRENSIPTSNTPTTYSSKLQALLLSASPPSKPLEVSTQSLPIELPSGQKMLDQAALQAAYEMGPQIYTLEGLKDVNNLIYWVIGCQGNGEEAQKAVAKLMADIEAMVPDKRPAFLLFLGDNFYKYGVNSPTDPAFKTHFHDIYKKGIRIFLLPGNHDANFQLDIVARLKSYNVLSLDQGKHLEFNQIAHTFVPQNNYDLALMSDDIPIEKNKIYLREKNGYMAYTIMTPAGEIKQDVIIDSDTLKISPPFQLEKLNVLKEQILDEIEKSGYLRKQYKSPQELLQLFKQGILNINDLQDFNMPHRFYGLDVGNTRIFCLDSNFLVQEFLEYMSDEKKEPTNPNHKNQIEWLLEKFTEAKNAGYDLQPLSKNKLEKGMIEFEMVDGKLKYRVIGLDGEEKSGEILLENSTKGSSLDPVEILNQKNIFIPEILKHTSSVGHTCPSKEIHIALHHPRKTSSKRADPEGHDSHHYLYDYQIRTLNQLLGYDLKLMSIDITEKLNTALLSERPHLIEIKDNETGMCKYQFWGYKDNQWQLTDLPDFTLPEEWHKKKEVYIHPKSDTYKVLQQNHSLGQNTTSYNEFIDLIFKRFGITGSKFLSAHDHFLGIDDNPDCLLITSGGGGGKLMNMKSCKRHEYVKQLLSHFGFNIISKDTVETYTVPIKSYLKSADDENKAFGFHTIYDTKKHEFIRNPSKDTNVEYQSKNNDNNIEALRDLIIEVCHQLFELYKQEELEREQQEKKLTLESSTLYNLFSKTSKKVSGLFWHNPREEDLTCAQEFMAYLNNPELPEYAQIINYLSDRLETLPLKEPKNNLGSFYSSFHKEFSSHFEMDLKSINFYPVNAM